MNRSFAIMVLVTVSVFAFVSTADGDAVPSAEAQRQALVTIREVFKDDLANAQTPAMKVALAKLLIQKAGETSDDPAGRYVLLKEAQSLATLGGDCKTVVAAAQATADAFAQDGLQTRSDAISEFFKTAKPIAVQRTAIESALSTIQEAVARDRYELAKQLADATLATARLVGDVSLVKQATACVSNVRAASEAFAAVEPQINKIASAPSDPVANLEVGSFRCFIQGDWTVGLPMLALGSDPTLRSLAEKEAGSPTATADLVALADAWWSVAEKKAGLQQQQIQAHAAESYRKAIPNLTGLSKAKVEKRLALLPATQKTADSLNEPVDVLKQIDLERDIPKIGFKGQSLEGKWHREKDGLVFDGSTGAGYLKLPQLPKGDYDLSLSFVPLKTNAKAPIVEIFLKRGEKALYLNLGRSGGAFAINGRTVQVKHAEIKDDSSHTIVIQIRQSTISATLDGVNVIKEKVEFPPIEGQAAFVTLWKEVSVRFDQIRVAPFNRPSGTAPGDGQDKASSLPAEKADSLKGYQPNKPLAFHLNDRKEFDGFWELSGDWQVSDKGLRGQGRSRAKPLSINSVQKFDGDVELIIEFELGGELKQAELYALLWGERVRLDTPQNNAVGHQVVRIKRHGDTLIVSRSNGPEKISIKEDAAARPSNISINASVAANYGESNYSIYGVSVQAEKSEAKQAASK